LLELPVSLVCSIASVRGALHHSFLSLGPGVRLAPASGVQPGLGRQILLSTAIVAAAILVRLVVGLVVRRAASDGPLHREGARTRFWIIQVTRLIVAVVAVVALTTLWVADAGRFAAMAGIITAGIAVALQRVITSFAAYLIILRGRVYTIGDRITMGGVRGDVVRVGYMQTAVMEMGAPPASQNGNPDTWIAARQYTGRIVSVTNDKIFDNPVYNFTREFPYMWDEMTFPIKYGADYQRAESILLAAARRQTNEYVEKAKPALEILREKYVLAEAIPLEPKVYLRLTDNWIELTLRILAPVHGVRAIKDAMGREILAGLQEAHLEIASGTYEIVGFPPIRIEQGTSGT
jgi:small-conductance mechanosensitive channel